MGHAHRSRTRDGREGLVRTAANLVGFTEAARDGARLASLKAHWDTRREAVRPLRADAAIDMVAPAHTYSTTTAFCDLSL